ncbi:T9SS type A sorting domain-containing protein [Flavobacterium sp. RHBU_24]|uniref:T9SS type A sorting domain-containing protein n=1 Tax=Flavobacterium sp. RHBU_24 TaxID=3391185 RepID=UPI00398483E2
MKKLLPCTLLLLALSATAQEYEWQWAKRGGGTQNAAGENSGFDFNSEHIVDIVVDADNNYYYMAFMTQNSTEYDGTPVTVYNSESSSSGNTDIVLLSTDCEGTLRWTQTIGGGAQDYAYKIALDNNGGLYIGANVLNISGPDQPYLPPHFSPTDAMPVLGPITGEPQEGYKTAALLKYNTSDGSLAWRVMPQGDVTIDLRYAEMHEVIVDSDGTLHTLIGFKEGTHLNGQLTVPAVANSLKYYIVKYNSDGDVLNVLPLSMGGSLYLEHTDFSYDEVLQRYYLAGYRSNGDIYDLLPFSNNGIPFTEQAFILAISNTGDEVWRREVSSLSDIQDNRIISLEVDDDSNLYITGKFFTDGQGISMGTYQFPLNVVGNINYTAKLNADGQVQWLTVPTAYSELSNPNFWSGSHFSYDIVINGNELAVATQVTDEIWGSVTIERPFGHLSEPALLHINKNTGTVLAVHDIMTSPGTRDGLTAVALDNDGNYITGGFFYNDLFTLPDDNVPTLTKVSGVQSYTDFFIAKLASGSCGSGTSGVEGHSLNNIKIYPNPSKGLINIASGETLKYYALVNLLGQVLLSGALQPSQNTISIESLSAGTYILNISTVSGNVMNRKIIKE